jgi:hypothetical protein
LQCVAMYCSMLQCVAMHCSVLQYVSDVSGVIESQWVSSMGNAL